MLWDWVDGHCSRGHQQVPHVPDGSPQIPLTITLGVLFIQHEFVSFLSGLAIKQLASTTLKAGRTSADAVDLGNGALADNEAHRLEYTLRLPASDEPYNLLQDLELLGLKQKPKGFTKVPSIGKRLG